MRANGRTQRVIRKITDVLQKNYKPKQIILFGSHAWGTPHRDSDIDLLIVKRTRKPFFKRLAEVHRLSTDVRRGHAFEPIVITPQELRRRLSRGDQFFRQILTQGRVLFAAR